jgi:hypothetical protein
MNVGPPFENAAHGLENLPLHVVGGEVHGISLGRSEG